MVMNLSTRELTAFLHVANLGSFTRAAEKMHVTQAGLSTMIRSLERQLCCRLFERTTRVVSLTEAGKALLPVATRTVSDLRSIAMQLRELNSHIDQSLRIGATPLVCSGFLPAICQEFLAAHPNITLEVVEIPFPQVHAQVEAGHVDLGLCVDALRQSTLERHPIFPVSLAFISASSTQHKGEKPGDCRSNNLRWEDLPAMPMIALKPDDPLQRYIDQELARVGRLSPPNMAVGSVETQIAMVQTGMGAAIVPSLALFARSYSGLEVRHIAKLDPTLDFCCFTKNGRRHTQAMSAFIEVSTREFSKAMKGGKRALLPARAARNPRDSARFQHPLVS